jgi:hypothetical protein
MNRRFFLVAVDNVWDDDVSGAATATSLTHCLADEGWAVPMIIPVDKVTAVVGAVWAGVHPEDVVGTLNPEAKP